MRKRGSVRHQADAISAFLYITTQADTMREEASQGIITLVSRQRRRSEGESHRKKVVCLEAESRVGLWGECLVRERGLGFCAQREREGAVDAQRKRGSRRGAR